MDPTDATHRAHTPPLPEEPLVSPGTPSLDLKGVPLPQSPDPTQSPPLSPLQASSMPPANQALTTTKTKSIFKRFIEHFFPPKDVREAAKQASKKEVEHILKDYIRNEPVQDPSTKVAKPIIGNRDLLPEEKKKVVAFFHQHPDEAASLIGKFCKDENQFNQLINQISYERLARTPKAKTTARISMHLASIKPDLVTGQLKFLLDQVKQRKSLDQTSKEFLKNYFRKDKASFARLFDSISLNQKDSTGLMIKQLIDFHVISKEDDILVPEKPAPLKAAQQKPVPKQTTPTSSVEVQTTMTLDLKHMSANMTSPDTPGGEKVTPYSPRGGLSPQEASSASLDTDLKLSSKDAVGASKFPDAHLKKIIQDLNSGQLIRTTKAFNELERNEDQMQELIDHHKNVLFNLQKMFPQLFKEPNAKLIQSLESVAKYPQERAEKHLQDLELDPSGKDIDLIFERVTVEGVEEAFYSQLLVNKKLLSKIADIDPQILIRCANKFDGPRKSSLTEYAEAAKLAGNLTAKNDEEALEFIKDKNPKEKAQLLLKASSTQLREIIKLANTYEFIKNQLNEFQKKELEDLIYNS